MNKPVVLIDIDDTIADSQVSLLARINERSERKYAFHEINEHYRNGGHPEYQAHMNDILSNPAHSLEIEPYDGALESIKKLNSAGYSLHIVTARGPELLAATKVWLRRHGMMEFVDGLHIRPTHVKGREFKRHVAATTKPLALFDDTLDVCEPIAQRGVPVYLIDKPWNRTRRLPPGILRMTSFNAAVDLFLSGA